MTLHSVLQRQLTKLGVSTDHAPTDAQWTALLAHLDDFYRRVDEDRSLLERSIEFSGEEMLTLHRRLREERDKLQRELDERVRTETALHASNARLSHISESGIVGVVRSDRSRIIEANDAFLRMLGYSREDLVAGAISWRESTTPESMPQTSLLEARLHAEGASLPIEKEYFRKDGTRVPAMLGVARLEDGTYIGLVLDLTERKKAEADLRRSEDQIRQLQKIEAIGSLAGGIAHDFNNHLSVILGYGSLLSASLPPESPFQADVGEINRAGERAAALTQQLLAFSRRQILQPRLVSLNDVVAGMERMLRRLIGEDIVMETLFEPGLGKVKVDPGQLEQVVMNVVVNSRDAMPAGGRLRIQTASVVLDARYVEAHPGLTSGPHVMLTITDTGTGMDAATLGRAFEPFFTTKPVGKGTGLGLSMVLGIVQQSGGGLDVESEPGRGTTFRVYFPRAEASDEFVPGPPGRKFSEGRETVLLVEDEDLVRAVVRRILHESGYRVIEAAGAVDAIELCEGHRNSIDLLLTDVVMPHMTGRQLTDILHRTKPGLKVLYMSGYTEDSIIHRGVLGDGVSFVPKPITPDALRQKIREVLDEHPRHGGDRPVGPG